MKRKYGKWQPIYGMFFKTKKEALEKGRKWKQRHESGLGNHKTQMKVVKRKRKMLARTKDYGLEYRCYKPKTLGSTISKALRRKKR